MGYDFKNFKEQEGISGYMLTWHQPYERSYSPELAYKVYKELSAKYPENPHRIKEDFTTAAKVGKRMKNEKKYIIDEGLFNNGFGSSS